MKKGDILDLEIIDYAFEGKGIAKIDKDPENPSDKKYIVFVDHSYPGDKIKAQLTKIKSGYAEARTLEILSSAPEREKRRCKYFGVCGGCKQQDLSYTAQIKYKQAQVIDVFRKLGGIYDLVLDEIIPSEKIYFYRNKMEFSFSDRRWLSKEEMTEENIADKNFALGLHIPNLFDKVIDIEECFLQSVESNDVLNFTRDFFKSRNSSIYTTKTHSGYLRNLIIKQSFHTKDFMINLVTSEENDQLMKEYTENLLDRFKFITTIINNISKKKALIAFGDYEKVYYGSGVIHDLIGEYKFRISANSFFQTNTLQAEKLYNKALTFADITQNDVVYDLYSGAGTIAIYISKYAKEVYGFENIEPAVDDARINVALNKTNNAEFFLADLNKSFLPLIESKNIPKPDIIIADPPRSGMNPNTIKDIIELSAEKIVYISCNPATQARDIKLLKEGGYILVRSNPVDMFPHTYHIENVALLKKQREII